MKYNFYDPKIHLCIESFWALKSTTSQSQTLGVLGFVLFKIFTHRISCTMPSTKVGVKNLKNNNWLKSVHFKKTVVQTSLLSKLLSVSLKSRQSQLMLYWKWQFFWKKWTDFSQKLPFDVFQLFPTFTDCIVPLDGIACFQFKPPKF